MKRGNAVGYHPTPAKKQRRRKLDAWFQYSTQQRQQTRVESHNTTFHFHVKREQQIQITTNSSVYLCSVSEALRYSSTTRSVSLCLHLTLNLLFQFVYVTLLFSRCPITNNAERMKCRVHLPDSYPVKLYPQLLWAIRRSFNNKSCCKKRVHFLLNLIQFKQLFSVISTVVKDKDVLLLLRFSYAQQMKIPKPIFNTF